MNLVTSPHAAPTGCYGTRLEDELRAALGALVQAFAAGRDLWAGIENGHQVDWIAPPASWQSGTIPPVDTRTRTLHVQLPGSRPMTLRLGAPREQGAQLELLYRVLTRGGRILQRLLRGYSPSLVAGTLLS